MKPNATYQHVLFTRRIQLDEEKQHLETARIRNTAQMDQIDGEIQSTIVELLKQQSNER